MDVFPTTERGRGRRSVGSRDLEIRRGRRRRRGGAERGGHAGGFGVVGKATNHNSVKSIFAEAPPPPTGGRGKFGAEEGFYDDVSDESESENESDSNNEFPLANQRAQPKGSFASSIQSLANDFGTRANVQTPSGGFYDS